MPWDAIASIGTFLAAFAALWSAWISQETAKRATEDLKEKIDLLEKNAKKTSARALYSKYHELALAHPKIASVSDSDPYLWFVSYAVFMAQMNLEAFGSDEHTKIREKMKHQLQFYEDSFAHWTDADRKLYGDEVAGLIDEISPLNKK